MTSKLLRKGVLAAAFAVLALAPAYAAPKHPAVPEAPAPPPPPPPPPTTLSAGIADAAAAYQSYLRQATAVSPSFSDGAQVQASLQQGEAYEPKALSRGMVAYAAIIALQDPTFVAGVKQYSKDATQRAEMVRNIFSDPAWAAQMPGAASAAGLIVAKFTADGDALAKVGVAVTQAARDMQKDKWSKETVANREGRLSLAKQLSQRASQAAPADSAVLMQAAISGEGLNLAPSQSKPPYTEMAVRGMAIAALAVLGAAGEENATQINALLDESTGPQCLSLAKLNLYQCLAVAKPHYEDVFCLGQHVLNDTGRCVQTVVGAAPHVMMFTERLAAKAAEDEARKAAAKTTKASLHHVAKKRKKKK